MKRDKIITNKVLFILGIAGFIVTSSYLLWWMLPSIEATEFEYKNFLITALSALVAYTLLFLSLKKTKILIKIYFVIVSIGIICAAIGIAAMILQK